MTSARPSSNVIGSQKDGVNPSDSQSKEEKDTAIYVSQTLVITLDDPRLFELYQSNIQKSDSFDLIIPLTVVGYSAIVTRYNLPSLQDESPLFNIAFACLVVLTVLFFPRLGTMMAIHYTPVNERHRLFYRLCRSYQVRMSNTRCEDIIGIFSVLAAGFTLLGRVYTGQCPPSTNAWTSQSCNPYADVQSIPNDQVESEFHL